MLIPLFKGIKVAPFVECPHCRAVIKYGAEKCSGCSQNVDLKEDALVFFCLLNTGAVYTPYTPFVECPNCRRLVRVGVRRCPDCYEEVTENYALTSALVVVTNTIACDLANSIRGFDAFAVLAVIGSVLIYAIDVSSGSPALFFFVLIWPLIPLFCVLLWFYRFGWFGVGDDEYLGSKSAMKRTLMLWLAILVAQLIALAVWKL